MTVLLVHLLYHLYWALTTTYRNKTPTIARVFTRTRKSDNMGPILSELHWLPIKFHMDYKFFYWHKAQNMNESFHFPLSQSVCAREIAWIPTPPPHTHPQAQCLQSYALHVLHLWMNREHECNTSVQFSLHFLSSATISRQSKALWLCYPHHAQVGGWAFGGVVASSLRASECHIHSTA